MRFERLQDWLAWQESLHPKLIDPGLERVSAVARRMGLDRAEVPVITVAGTNGKGSTVAHIDAMLRRAGHRVGAYGSPHMLAYNERVRIDGSDASDAQLMDAFAAIDEARGEISLSYFEFGTLAALWCFRQARCDVLVLEVGMGGRLDATNLLDADVAVVVSVALDHCEWLGPDRDSIALEKAGILRAGRPAVYGEPDVPGSLVDRASALGAPLAVAGRDFGARIGVDGGWSWWSRSGAARHRLPPPALAGDHQYANAAAALAALAALEPRLPVPDAAVRAALAEVRLSGRLQRIPGPVEWVLDVAHNAAACAGLAASLAAWPVAGRTIALFGLMRRKDLDTVIEPMLPVVDEWLVLPLPDEEARPASEVAAALRARGAEVHCPGSIEALRTSLAGRAAPGDRVLAFGSFRVVEMVLREGVVEVVAGAAAAGSAPK